MADALPAVRADHDGIRRPPVHLCLNRIVNMLARVINNVQLSFGLHSRLKRHGKTIGEYLLPALRNAS